MPGERAGYTVSMFIIDVSASMGTTRSVEVQDTSSGASKTVEMSNLEYGLQYIKMKIQEMIFNGRKTDQCGVILCGSEDTRNIVNDATGEYDNILEYLPIAQPNASTIAKLDALEASITFGDPIDALIVAIETQNKYLASKKSWTRRITLLTDGETPIAVEDWEVTVKKMNMLNIHLSIVGIDFDDEELPYTEIDKSDTKRQNEQFYQKLTSALSSATMGTCELALQSANYPDPKAVKSSLITSTLRIGDTNNSDREEEALEFSIKASKCTSLARPKTWKKFILRQELENSDSMMVDTDNSDWAYVPLKMETRYYNDRNRLHGNSDENGDVNMKKEDEEEEDGIHLSSTEAQPKKPDSLEELEKEDLVRGFKYGTTYAPCPDGQFPRLDTRKGIDICGFFPRANYRRELSMGEIQYIWADPSSAQQQVALSSFVQAMQKKGVLAIARWVSRDGMDPKMGVLIPVTGDNVHYLLWGQMPFSDDVRKYTFASLNHLVNKKGEILTEHPYLPTQEQLDTMDNFVDSMDLMGADEDEDGERRPWFQTINSYNPAIHRVKQAMFHCAIVSDLSKYPLPPPHPELTKYFEPPVGVVEKARTVIEECKTIFNVKRVPKRIIRTKKDDHVHAQDDEDDMLLLNRKAGPFTPATAESRSSSMNDVKIQPTEADSETEDDDDDVLLNRKPTAPVRGPTSLPLTPARSPSLEVDFGRASNRIVGTSFPLKDFEGGIAQAMVSKAVEDLCIVIAEILFKPFANRRTVEIVECVTALRRTCLENNKVLEWNTFISHLKDRCLSSPGNVEFWEAIQEKGRDLSLISEQEANQQGAKSTVTENEAGEFMSENLGI